MELSPCDQFLLEDSSESDDSDVEMLLANHRQQMAVVVLAVKEFEICRGGRGEDPKSASYAFPGIVSTATSCSCKTTSPRYQPIRLTSSVEGTECVDPYS